MAQISQIISKSLSIISAPYSSYFPDKCESSFDNEELNSIKLIYLPSKYKEKCPEPRLPSIPYFNWIRNLTCDLRLLCRCVSLQILIIWILSLTMFLMYSRQNCSNNYNNNNNNELIELDKIPERINVDVPHGCTIVLLCTWNNFLISTILIAILQFYICHLIEFCSIIPILLIEIILSFLFIFLLFFCSIFVSVAVKQTLITHLCLIQMILCVFYRKSIVIFFLTQNYFLSFKCS